MRSQSTDQSRASSQSVGSFAATYTLSVRRTQYRAAAPAGHVTVDCSGIEMGQGLNTMVCQAVVLGLNKLFPANADANASADTKAAPLTLAAVSTNGLKSTAQFPAASGTSGSGTTESCCDAATKACAKIVALLAPHRSPQGWVATVRAAASKGVALTGVEGTHLSGGSYFIYAAGCTVVELDVLTGECEILSQDIVYDSGTSLNPSLGFGQVEGCYVMAAGMCLTEHQVRSGKDGRLVNNGTWCGSCSTDVFSLLCAL
eukprot:SAG22_NODE_371_length_11566_cov_5.447458_7_plen_259_part_00